MSGVFDLKVNNLVANIVKTAKLASKYGNEDSKNLDNYSNLVENICKTKHEHARARRSLDLSKTAVEVKEFEQKYEENMLEKLVRVEETNEYKTIMTQVKNELERNRAFVEGDRHNSSIIHDEDMIIGGEISDKDPITKRRMENPVRNKICKHHYDKDSILEAIKVNSHLRCPVAGCGNKRPVRQSDLENDVEFLQRLRRMQDD